MTTNKQRTQPTDPVRRIHPRLRMIRNGNSTVNAVRAQISTTVASTFAEAEARVLESAQEKVRSLDAGVLEVRGKLTKRPKLQKPADDAFVNVFIELDEDLVKQRDEGQALCAHVRGLLDAATGEIRSAVVQRGRYVSATVPVSALAELEANESIGFVSYAEPLKLEVPFAEVARKPRPRRVAGSTLHRDGQGVLIGIIDVGGFDFAHEEFLDDRGETRFVRIWDQSGDFRRPPARFGYGAEFDAARLNAAIAQAKEPGGLPAREYERQSQRTPGSHGTHVASIAAGRHGVCPKADIAGVLVHVPHAADERERRRQAFSDTSRIAHAVEYLLDLARERGQPVSINVSLGTNGGAHDGANGVNRWLDHALTTPGRAISIAAGNAGQERATSAEDFGFVMGRIHSSGRVPSRGLEVELEWTVVGNGIADLSENELEIWYNAQDRFSVSVKPPDEDRWYEARPQEYWENKRLSGGTTLSIYNELYNPSNGANYIAIYLSPNLDPANLRGIQAGLWRVRLIGEEVRDGRFHAWIERDDPAEIGRTPDARFYRYPSFFSTRSHVDSHSISSLACGNEVIAVGNLDDANGVVNITSSQGPTRDGRSKPDVLAPGTKISAANGFAAEDEGPWIEMTGTSMATPYVAGVLGLMLATNRELTSAQCAGILQRTAQPLPGASYEWHDAAGFGVIRPAAAVKEAASFAKRKERR